MSERLNVHHEHQEAETTKEHSERHPKSPEHHPKHNEQRPDVETIKQSVEQEAIGKEEIAVDKHPESQRQNQPHYVNKELKKITFDRTMARVRRKLNAPDRILSKAIHQPSVDALSRVGEKTIARPVGLLTGSVFAFLGTTFALYMSKHYGFRYNFLLFVLLFVGGFVLGTVLELLLGLLKKHPHK